MWQWLEPDDLPEPRVLLRVLSGIVLVVFGSMATYLALHLKEALVPDETWHLAVIRLVPFPDVWNLRQVPEANYLGPYTRMPHVYHQILAVVSRLRPETWPELAYLRVLNVLLSLGTLLVVHRTVHDPRDQVSRASWPC